MAQCFLDFCEYRDTLLGIDGFTVNYCAQGGKRFRKISNIQSYAYINIYSYKSTLCSILLILLFDKIDF